MTCSYPCFKPLVLPLLFTENNLHFIEKQLCEAVPHVLKRVSEIAVRVWNSACLHQQPLQNTFHRMWRGYIISTSNSDALWHFVAASHIRWHLFSSYELICLLQYVSTGGVLSAAVLHRGPLSGLVAGTLRFFEVFTPLLFLLFAAAF